VETAREMLEAVTRGLPADIGGLRRRCRRLACGILYRQQDQEDGGMPGACDRSLAENPDILKTIAGHRTLRPGLVVGFAAETDDVLRHAERKAVAQGCRLAGCQ
jgi:phosphopantothenoylcysteine decarboxylase/phosphopantothenate--cysteine ligase